MLSNYIINKCMVYSSTADASILNFPRYIADMLYWWASSCDEEEARGGGGCNGSFGEEMSMITAVGDHVKE